MSGKGSESTLADGCITRVHVPMLTTHASSARHDERIHTGGARVREH